MTQLFTGKATLNNLKTTLKTVISCCYDWNIPGEMIQCHNCWCYRAWRGQAIGSHDIENARII